jgi:hypothetical protein
MFRSVRKRLTYANVAMTLALVLAMTGGAYAAGRFVITSTKQIKPSVLAQLKGRAGAAGATGVAGVAGVAGPQGPAGANGKDGAQGPEGKQGQEGKEGKEGPAGTTGFTKTLPPGRTETGTWILTGVPPGAPAITYTAISFPIPLAGPLGASEVHFIKENETAPAGCTGGTVSQPTAEAGNLCIYTTFEEKTTNSKGTITDPAKLELGASANGALLTIGLSGTAEKEQALAVGTWAVTAPTT